MKRCAKCKEEKEVEYFSKNPQQKDGRHVYCKDCVKAYHGQYYKEHREGLIDAGRKRREANPEGFAAYHKRYRLVARNKIKNQRLVKAYGITLDAWYVLFKKQGRQCAICKTNNPGARGWQTDHDHETKEVRGILCVSCNNGLGRFKDSVEYLKEAIDYILRK